MEIYGSLPCSPETSTSPPLIPGQMIPVHITATYLSKNISEDSTRKFIPYLLREENPSNEKNWI
jgi:hypothetical protein